MNRRICGPEVAPYAQLPASTGDTEGHTEGSRSRTHSGLHGVLADTSTRSVPPLGERKKLREDTGGVRYKDHVQMTGVNPHALQRLLVARALYRVWDIVQV